MEGFEFRIDDTNVRSRERSETLSNVNTFLRTPDAGCVKLPPVLDEPQVDPAAKFYQRMSASERFAEHSKGHTRRPPSCRC